MKNYVSMELVWMVGGTGKEGDGRDLDNIRFEQPTRYESCVIIIMNNIEIPLPFHTNQPISFFPDH